MQDLPIYIDILFVITALATCTVFYRATHRNAAFLVVIGLWMLLQSGVALTGFYAVTDTFPPRFVVLIGIPLLCISGLFILKKGRDYIDGLDMKYLILLHAVRIPVEIVLYLLYLNKKILLRVRIMMFCRVFRQLLFSGYIKITEFARWDCYYGTRYAFCFLSIS